MLHSELLSTAHEIPEGWDDIGNDNLLKKEFLIALEQGSPGNIHNYYLAVFKDGKIVGRALFQHVKLNVGNMLRYWPDNRFVIKIKSTLSCLLKGHILVCGNLTHTGQHLFDYDKSKISPSDWSNILKKSVDRHIAELRARGIKIQMVLLKDFNDSFNGLDFSILDKVWCGYKAYVQPSMELLIPSNWTEHSSYTGLLTKKYRRRYLTARRKIKDLKLKELDLASLRREQDILYSLYLNVSNNAKFNTFVLPSDHFVRYKDKLGDNFKVFGYYEDGKLIGFYTLILNGDILETYFLGYNSECLKERQLYLNMLYGMLEYAIDNKFQKVVYARTALEIKSSVGAEAKPMFMYIFHTNRLWNIALKPIFNWLNPEENWIPRNPFRQDFT